MIVVPSTTTKRWQIVTAFIAVYLVWGSTYLAIRFAVEEIPPFFLAGVRFGVAGSILYTWLRIRGAKRPDRLHWRSAIILGALLFLVDNGGVCWAEQHITSSLTVLFMTIVPVWMVLLEWTHASGVRPTITDVFGISIGLVGVASLLAADDVGAGLPVHGPAAVVLLLASLAWAIGSVHSRYAPLPQSALLAASMQMMAGGGLLLLASIAVGEPSRIRLDLTPLAIGSLTYLTFFGGIIAFSAYIFLLRVVSPAKVSTFAFVNPMVAVLLGCTVGGEPMTARTIGASLSIIAAAALITTRRTRCGLKPGAPALCDDSAGSPDIRQDDKSLFATHAEGTSQVTGLNDGVVVRRET